MGPISLSLFTTSGMSTRVTTREYIDTSLLSQFDFNRARSRFDRVNEFIRVVVVPVIFICQRSIDENRNGGPRFTLSWQLEYGLGNPTVVICATRESGPRMRVLPIQVMTPGTLTGEPSSDGKSFVAYGQALDRLQEMIDYTADLGENRRYAMLTDILSSAFISHKSVLGEEVSRVIYMKEREGNKTKVCMVGFLLEALSQLGCPLPPDA